MMTAITISVIAGLAIGLHFKVFMVVPAIVATALPSAMLSIAHGDTFWTLASTIAIGAVSVQLGYLCGTFAASMREVPLAQPAKADVSPAAAYSTRSEISIS